MPPKNLTTPNIGKNMRKSWTSMKNSLGVGSKKGKGNGNEGRAGGNDGGSVGDDSRRGRVEDDGGIGRYQQGRKLSRGGSAVVYEGKDTVTNTVVALKKYREELKGAHNRFPAELEVMELLKKKSDSLEGSEYLVQMLDTIGENTMVLEFVDGVEMGPWLQKHPETAHSCLEQALKGLRALANEGIVHADIKWENILVTKDCRLKIVDFGLSSIWVRINGGYGTWETAPPEAFREPNPHCVHKSDVFALGVTFYQCLEDQYPFEPDPQPENYDSLSKEEKDKVKKMIWHKAVTKQPEPKFKKTPIELQGVLSSMMTRDEKKRPSAGEALDMLASSA